MAQDGATAPAAHARRRVAAQFHLPFSQVWGLGLVLFRDSAHAWLLDGSVTARSGVRFTDSTGTPQTLHEQWVAVRVRVGQRRYSFPARGAATFRTLGLVGGYSNPPVEGFAGDYDAFQGSLGAFAEVGAAFFPWARISVGAIGRLEASYGRTWAKGSGARFSAHAWSVQAEELAVTVTIYF